MRFNWKAARGCLNPELRSYSSRFARECLLFFPGAEVRSITEFENAMSKALSEKGKSRWRSASIDWKRSPAKSSYWKVVNQRD